MKCNVQCLCTLLTPVEIACQGLTLILHVWEHLMVLLDGGK